MSTFRQAAKHSAHLKFTTVICETFVPFRTMANMVRNYRASMHIYSVMSARVTNGQIYNSKAYMAYVCVCTSVCVGVCMEPHVRESFVRKQIGQDKGKHLHLKTLINPSRPNHNRIFIIGCL